MKWLLIVTALIEVGAGLALLCFPSATVALLLGSQLDAPAGVALRRLAGTALFGLGLALWPAVALHVAMTVWCISSLLGKLPRNAVPAPKP